MSNEWIKDIPDFRNIDVHEELADGELSDMVTPNDLIDRMMKRRSAMAEGISLPFEKLKDTDFLLHKGSLNLIGGYTGHFKSTIASQIGLRALRQGYKVGIASLELFAEDVLEQYTELSLCQPHADLEYVKCFSEWAKEKLFIYDRMDAITPEESIQMCIAFAKYCGCDLIVLDALMMMGVCGDPTIEQQFTQTLASVAKRFGVTILLVHHVRKPSGMEGEERLPGKYDFIGSSHLSNIAASIMLVWHDKIQAEKRAQQELGAYDPDYNPNQNDMIFKVAKNRYGRYEGSIRLWQAENCRGFVSNDKRVMTPFGTHQMNGSLRAVI